MGKLRTGNGNPNTNKGMLQNKKCQYCGRTQAMEWAKDNHEQHCETNPNRGRLE